MKHATRATDDYGRIESAIHFLADHVEDQPTLADVAAEVGLSAYHLQRVFKRWAGVSPKRLLQLLTVEHAKELLDRSTSVLDTTYEVGLTSPARLHDHFVTLEAMTPGEYKSTGQNLVLRWGLYPSPFGDMFVAATDRGICRLTFPEGAEVDTEVDELRRRWPQSRIDPGGDGLSDLAGTLFATANGSTAHVALHVQGTNFQVAVWRALLSIPEGSVSTYSRIAERIERPQAVRAVGNAVGANPVAYLIPCHRVIRQVGALGGYRWGTDRKRALLAWESARAETA